MQVLLQHIMNGITVGAMYASVAIGLSLVFGVVRVTNFAQGDAFMVASFLFFVFYTAMGMPYAAVIVLCIVLMALYGVVFERIVVRPVLGRAWYLQLISTLAAAIILKNGARLIWGSTPRATPTPHVSSFIKIGGFEVSHQRLIVLVVAVISFAALQYFLQRTRLGKALRAVSQNRDASTIVGIDVKSMSRLTFALSAALAALGAVAVTPLFNVYPDMGGPLIVKAFAAVTVGGFGQVKGAIYGSLLLGVAEALATGYVSAAYKDVIAFGIIVLVLIVRPQGLFGRGKVGI